MILTTCDLLEERYDHLRPQFQCGLMHYPQQPELFLHNQNINLSQDRLAPSAGVCVCVKLDIKDITAARQGTCFIRSPSGRRTEIERVTVVNS